MNDRPIDHAFYEQLCRDHKEICDLLAKVHRVLADCRETPARVSQLLTY